METVKIKLTQLEPNRGQVQGLPKNPRKVDEAATIEFPSHDTSADISPDDFGDDFKLPDGEKGNVQVMSFSFVNERG